MTPYTKRKNQFKKRILRKENRIRFLRGLGCAMDEDGNLLYKQPPKNLVTETTWDGVESMISNLEAEVELLRDKLNKHKVASYG